MKPAVCRTAKPRLGAALLLSATVVLMGCQSKSAKLGATDPLTTASTSEPSFKKTAELGELWRSNPKDTKLGLAYADSLAQIGQGEQRMQVYERLASQNPEDMTLKATYGKALLETGRSGEAIAVLEEVAASGKADWKAHSALGSAYDQDSQHSKARQQYEKALALKPGELTVVNNIGMSHAVEGDLPQAEKVLKDAMAQPGSAKIPRIRQNLALVVGLQGRFDESRDIASADLPPDQVEANLAYLQKMLSQSNTWKQLAGDGNGT
jgi:Flp pilus assembly protein TadD